MSKYVFYVLCISGILPEINPFFKDWFREGLPKHTNPNIKICYSVIGISFGIGALTFGFIQLRDQSGGGFRDNGWI
jgi:hypothetical protein